MFIQLATSPLLMQLGSADQPISKPVLIMLVLLVLSLAPFILMMSTSFVKIAVVLSLIRSALGTQQIPPNQIVMGLSLILTVYIMIPVGEEVYNEARTVMTDPAASREPLLSEASVNNLKKVFTVGKEPVRRFLERHASVKEKKVFWELAYELRPEPQKAEIADNDFIVLLPAFIISELSEAFQIGFIIFLPFLIIDMVVSNILLSMGMFMVSPVTVSLPFKLLLFVLADGWSLIAKGLVKGYVNS